MGLDTDGPFLFPAMDEAGLDYEVVSWDDPKAKWNKYSTVVLRASWDYFNRVDEFRDVLDHISSVSTLFNPLEAVEWNIDKRYLKELSKAGLPTVTTTFVSHLSPPTELGNALALVSRWGSAEVMVKPTVSAGSNDTFRLDATDGSAITKAVQAIVDSDRVAIVQPFLAGVDSYGERGCVYFSGEFDHAFSRKVMLAPGGQDAAVLSAPETVGPAELSAEERIIADRANSWLTDRFGSLLYSRIDIFPSPDGPLIGEVELIEPSLFFEVDPPSAKRFVAVLGEAVSTGTQ